jgi:hypothetical protein
MILATPRLQATSRGGGKSGSGCGKAPPRAEFMPHAGTIEVVRKVTSVSNATIEGFCRDKERNERLACQPPGFKANLGRSAQAICHQVRDIRSRKSYQYFLKHKEACQASVTADRERALAWPQQKNRNISRKACSERCRRNTKARR